MATVARQGHLVTILCQSRLFSPQKEVITTYDTKLRNHPLSIEAIFPTRNEADFFNQTLIRNHPLSIEAIFPTMDRNSCWVRYKFSNHPLSIEAIFPTGTIAGVGGGRNFVTILCQSRLFSPRRVTRSSSKTVEVTILCQSRLFSPRIQFASGGRTAPL